MRIWLCSLLGGELLAIFGVGMEFEFP